MGLKMRMMMKIKMKMKMKFEDCEVYVCVSRATPKSVCCLHEYNNIVLGLIGTIYIHMHISSIMRGTLHELHSSLLEFSLEVSQKCP